MGRLLDFFPFVSPQISDREVAERLASYDMLAVAVCDQAGRLLGSVTVDDVIDRMLGPVWRKRQRPSRTPEVSAT
jgi:Mg/Co/Ni transporter MgtE